jgi:hypothetical protein
MINRIRRSRFDYQTIRAIRADRAHRATTHARISTTVVPTPPVSAGGAAGGNQISAGGTAGGSEVIS